MRKISFIVACLLSLISLGEKSAYALESDQFMMLTRTLKDIGPALNDHVNETIKDEINRANKKGASKFSCQEVHTKAVKRFRGFIIHKIEKWLEHEQGENLYPYASVNYPRYYKESIYSWKFGLIARLFPMGRNLRVGEVYLGADKLAHFFSTGLRYFTVYKKAQKKGKNAEDSMKEAIEYGISLENTILGLWPAGVYSFGDLEANFQGLLFNLQFCDSENPYLGKDEDGNWQLRRSIELLDYINPNFDETYNPSYFGSLKWGKISANLKRYCSVLEGPEARSRREIYDSIAKESFSVNYLQSLRDNNEKRVPDRKKRSIYAVCPELN